MFVYTKCNISLNCQGLILYSLWRLVMKNGITTVITTLFSKSSYLMLMNNYNSNKFLCNLWQMIDYYIFRIYNEKSQIIIIINRNNY